MTPGLLGLLSSSCTCDGLYLPKDEEVGDPGAGILGCGRVLQCPLVLVQTDTFLSEFL